MSAATHPPVPGGPPAAAPARPKFNSRVTSDRLREGAGLFLPPLFGPGSSSNIRKGRTSVFRETGLDGDGDGPGCASPAAAVGQGLLGAACARS